MSKITFLTCWGSIDKDYLVWKGTYNFHIWEPVIKKIIDRFDINQEFEIIKVLKKDSLDMDENDRLLIKQKLENSSGDIIIITQWTDTMIDTWKAIWSISDKVVVLVGSSIPWSMNNSDAELNIWYSLWISNVLIDEKKYWVYLAMNWEYFDLNNVEKWDDWVFRKIR